MMHLGPWRFTNEDARRTLEVLPEVVEHAAWARPEGMFDPLKATARKLQRDAHGDLETRLGAAWELMASIRPTIAAEGLLPPTTPGTVSGLFVSNGGVPKHAISAAEVSFDGMAGDRQATRRHHGRPWQALCLWSTDVVTAFQRGGHPIDLGAAGENISISDIDWNQVRPGVRVRVGSVLAEVSTYSIPCRNNARWFTDGRFDTMHHHHGPVSRVYATVLEPGVVAVGDASTLEP
jgi:hypothetical protein